MSHALTIDVTVSSEVESLPMKTYRGLSACPLKRAQVPADACKVFVSSDAGEMAAIPLPMAESEWPRGIREWDCSDRCPHSANSPVASCIHLPRAGDQTFNQIMTQSCWWFLADGMP